MQVCRTATSLETLNTNYKKYNITGSDKLEYYGDIYIYIYTINNLRVTLLHKFNERLLIVKLKESCE